MVLQTFIPRSVLNLIALPFHDLVMFSSRATIVSIPMDVVGSPFLVIYFVGISLLVLIRKAVGLTTGRQLTFLFGASNIFALALQ